MKILIAGCGQVGQTLAQELSAEGHDLTLMDSDPQVLEVGMERYDVIAIQGNCASMQTLHAANAEDADLLIACTGSDELNLLCCMTAHAINPHLHTIARIRNHEYAEQTYRMRDTFALSMIFNPEQQAAQEIERLLRFPGFLKRDSFAKGRVEIVELRVDADSRLRDIPLSALNTIVKCKVLVCTVLRGEQAITPDGRFVLRAGDRIFVTAPSENLAQLLKNLGIVQHKIRNVMVVGGGTLGYYLADLLQHSALDLTVIEQKRARCVELASAFPRVNVICGDAREQSLLESEGISSADALIALTELDELNLLISLYGQNRNIPQIVTRLENLTETGITRDLTLGSVICPRRLCCNNIVRYVRAMQNQEGAAVAAHSIADGQAEALEFVVDKHTLHCGEPLKKLKLKKNVLLAAIISGGKTEIPSGDSVFEVGDSVLIVETSDDVIRQLNDIFA